MLVQAEEEVRSLLEILDRSNTQSLEQQEGQNIHAPPAGGPSNFTVPTQVIAVDLVRSVPW